MHGHKTVADILDHEFPIGRYTNPEHLCAGVEEYLSERLRAQTIESCMAVASDSGKEVSRIGMDGFTIDRIAYVLKLVESGTTRVMEIHVLDDTAKCGKRRQRTLPFSSAGRYDRVRVEAPESFQPVFDNLLEGSLSLLQAGYVWLSGRVLWELERTREKLSEDLYLYVRTRLPEKLFQFVWFFVLSNEEGVYLADRSLLSGALLRVSTSAARTFMSPLELLSQMTTCVLPAQDTHSVDALREGKTLPMSFNNPKYAETGLQVAESAVYQCRDVMVHPLVKEDDAYLTVGYPADRASDLGQFFDSGKPWFRDVVLKHKRFLRRLMCEIKEQGALPGVAGRVAYVTGQFLRGLGDLPSAQG